MRVHPARVLLPHVLAAMAVRTMRPTPPFVSLVRGLGLVASAPDVHRRRHGRSRRSEGQHPGAWACGSAVVLL